MSLQWNVSVTTGPALAIVRGPGQVRFPKRQALVSRSASDCVPCYLAELLRGPFPEPGFNTAVLLSLLSNSRKSWPAGPPEGGGPVRPEPRGPMSRAGHPLGLPWAFCGHHRSCTRFGSGVCAQPGGPDALGLAAPCRVRLLIPYVSEAPGTKPERRPCLLAGIGSLPLPATVPLKPPAFAGALLRLPAPALRGPRCVLRLAPSAFGLGQPSPGLDHGVFEHPPFAMKSLDTAAAQMDVSPLAPHGAHRRLSFHFSLSQV